MTRYVTLEQALDLAELATGGTPEIRDLGLLESALHRPQTSFYGQDAYPDVYTKAAALLQSITCNHALIDGNKRLAWTLTDVFYRYNDVVLAPPEDDAYDLVVAVAAGKLLELEDISRQLRDFAD